jgi:hypothetical protein
MLSRLVLLALRHLFGGETLHRAGLHAFARGRYPLAQLLFEAALERYRSEVEVEQIARLRVHQLIARVRAGGAVPREVQLCLDVERRLCKLDRIQSLEPPFELVEAGSLLGTWFPPGTDTIPATIPEQRLAA